jgi:hypothetical protein
MTVAIDLLDRWPTEGDDRARSGWYDDVADSLRSDRRRWVEEVGPPGSEQLSRERAWVLLGWAELSADVIVNQRSARTVRLVGFALSLLEASPLDRRDVMVVAILLRRACTLAGLDFAKHVGRGCRDAGDLGAACAPWLSRVVDPSPSPPSTHEEIREGSTLHFRRKQDDIDLERLERWFNDNG